MLVTSSDSVGLAHGGKVFVGKQNRCSASLSHTKVRCGELEPLRCSHYLVNPAPLFFTNAKSAHKVSNTFVTRAIFVDESFDLDGWQARIGDFNSVRIHLNHHGSAAGVVILVYQCVSNQLPQSLLWKHLHFFSHHLLNKTVPGSGGMDKIHLALEANGIATVPRFVVPGHKFVSPLIDHHPWGLTRQRG